MQEKFIRMGEVEIMTEPGILTCRGIGSCIALFLFDKILKIAAGAHIMLPNASQSMSGTFCAEGAINELFHQLSKYGCNHQSLRAKMTGGASLFIHSHSGVGQKNIEAVISHLRSRRVLIAATDIGGNQNRIAKYHVPQGNLEIWSGENRKCIL